MQVLGIDIGGSGIKAAVVDTVRGEMIGERFRLDTPSPASPEPVTEVITAAVRHFEWNGLVGCGFPGPVKHGVVRGAANLTDEWAKRDVDAMFEAATGCEFFVANDADAAGLAEMRFGAGRDATGVTFLATLGTGSGTAVFLDGGLLANTELGHLEIDGKDAEKSASARAREKHAMSWKQWAAKVDRYLHKICDYLSPDLIIIGGGVSKRHEKFLPLLTVDVRVVPAELRNRAGIVGAALHAAEAMERG